MDETNKKTLLAAAPNKKDSKSEKTRKKILLAAQKIFSRHPYAAATTRMIAKEAKVDHPLIYYHFGSKEELFGAMASDMLQEFTRALSGWFEGMEALDIESGMKIFITRVVDYTMSHPETMRLFLINMAQEQATAEIPGFEYFNVFAKLSRKSLSGVFPNLQSFDEVDRFIISFANFVISFVGGKVTQAHVVGFGPESPKYRKWVKDTLLVIFMPWLERLVTANKSRG